MVLWVVACCWRIGPDLYSVMPARLLTWEESSKTTDRSLYGLSHPIATHTTRFPCPATEARVKRTWARNGAQYAVDRDSSPGGPQLIPQPPADPVRSYRIRGQPIRTITRFARGQPCSMV